MKYFILFAAVCGTALGLSTTEGDTGYDCQYNYNCYSDKCCPDDPDIRRCCGGGPGYCCTLDTDDCCTGVVPEDDQIRFINPEQCYVGLSCKCRMANLSKKLTVNNQQVEYKLCPGTPASVVSEHCRSDPCNDACPQNNANILLVQLDRLSPANIQGIFKRDEQVSFYLGCSLGTGPCDGVGGAFKEALIDWAVSKQVCGRCNACQKRKVSYIISQLRNNPQYKTRYDQILAKFGRSGK